MRPDKLPKQLFEPSPTDPTKHVATWDVLCQKCQYDLKGIPIQDAHVKCPECGYLNPIGINEYLNDLEDETPMDVAAILQKNRWWIALFFIICLVSYMILDGWL